jgi:hypothetical protein
MFPGSRVLPIILCAREVDYSPLAHVQPTPSHLASAEGKEREETVKWMETPSPQLMGHAMLSIYRIVQCSLMRLLLYTGRTSKAILVGFLVSPRKKTEY